MPFKSTFDPKAVQKKHKEIEKKFQAIADALKDAKVDDATINDRLHSYFAQQINDAINSPDYIGKTITEPDDETF